MSKESPNLLSDEDGYGDKPIEVSEAKYTKISTPVGHRVYHTDDLITNYEHLNLEYETFGSMNDNVTKVVPALVYEDSTFDESREEEHTPKEAGAEQPQEEDATQSRYVDVITQTGEEPVVKAASEPKTPVDENIPQLQVLKTRDNNANVAAARRVSSFKAKKINDPTRELSTSDEKLEEMAGTFKDLDTRIHKIHKEIKFLDSLLPPNNFLNSKPDQQERLIVARKKLLNKAEHLEKEKYELGIKIQTRSVKVNGYNGGDRAQFWVRGVSN